MISVWFRKAEQTDDLDQKLYYYNMALKLDPNNAAAYVDRSSVYVEKQDFEAARADLDKAISIDPQHAGAFNNRGTLFHYYLKDYKAAMREYNESIRLDPTLFMAWSNRGALHAAMGNHEAAIEDYTKAIPTDMTMKATYGRALVYVHLGKYAEAIEDFNRVIQQLPDLPDTYDSRGVCLTEIGEFEAAIRDYTEAIRLRPDDTHFYNNRGYCYYAYLQNYTEALKDLNKAIQLQADNIMALYNRAMTYAVMEDYEPAIRDLDEVLRINTQDVWAYVSRGWYKYEHSNDLEGAISDQTKALELNPTEFQALLNRGELQCAAEQYDDALNTYASLIAHHPDNVWGYSRRAVIHMHKENFTEAIVDYTRAIDIEPSHACYCNRGLCYSKLEDYDSAIRDLSEAIRLVSEPRASLFRSRGYAYLKRKDYQAAIDDFEEALRIDPDDESAKECLEEAYKGLAGE